jgi:hypothetical protein
MFFRFIYFTYSAFNEIDINTENYLFACVQITEIFYILNYSINFYLYCLSGTLFRKQMSDIQTVVVRRPTSFITATKLNGSRSVSRLDPFYKSQNNMYEQKCIK